MTVLELPTPLPRDLEAFRRPELRLLEGEAEARPLRRGPSAEVRRRRTLLVVMGLLLGALALPLGGAGGHSHAPGSVPAGIAHPTTYTVRSGDTLWTIAEQAHPGADPRPFVARMAAQLGTDQVTPGEQVTIS
ncbi:MAG: LysM peptidoglycan-binding domain-containing protein [Acidimicrobiales bacterium]|nr:LysM peptidoglycan-binding domain-containing protein [Acidimicrobiales bacterium]